MRALLTDDSTKVQAQELMAFARRNIYRPGTNEKAPGDDPHFVMHIRDGYRVVFSYTADPRTGKLFRHLSVSVDGPKYPSLAAVAAIACLFEFSGTEDENALIGNAAANQFPDGWMVAMNKEEHCIIMAEELK